MAKTQLQLSFLEQQDQDDPVPVLTTLSNDQRAEMITALARLIAKLTTAGRTDLPADPNARESDHER